MTSVIEKLQKLIAHQKSASDLGNQAEAEAFAAKVQELLFAHSLSMSEVEVEEQERDEPIEAEYVRDTALGTISRRCEWLERLSGAIAKSCFCHRWICPGRNTQVFVGRTSDRLAAAAMFRYLANSAIAICETEFKVYRVARDPRYHDPGELAAQSRIWKRSFFLGFASAIGRRLATDSRTLTANASGSEGLILIQRKERAVELWAEQKLQGKKSAPAIGGAEPNYKAYLQGASRGNEISLKAKTALTGGAL